MSSSRNATLSVHDPEFKNLITVPLAAVHHLPPAHLEISRLVLCRKYDPQDPFSCAMGEGCKFVHIDMSTPQLQVHTIHVNYAYRTAEQCELERLPAGEMIAVMAPNNRAPSQLVPSELIMVTKGSMGRHTNHGPLSHCAHYYYNRMCNRGERCGFVHCLYIDPNAADFQRAPPRSGAVWVKSKQSTTTGPTAMTCAPPLAHHRPASESFSHSTSTNTIATVPTYQYQSRSSSVNHLDSIKTLESSSIHCGSSCDLSESPRSVSERSVIYTPTSSSEKRMPTRVYRHNPYSLLEVTTLVVA